MFIPLEVVADAEPVISYGLKHRLLLAGAILIPFFTLEYFYDWLDQMFFQSIWGVRALPAWFFLDLRSRLIIAPFIAAVIFVFPNPTETGGENALFRFALAGGLALVVAILWIILGWKGAERF